jgi:hypothetical protein
MNATVGGQTLLPNTTLFSGDSLQVKDGVAVVALGSTSRMVFGRDTVASFLRDSNEVTVLLGQGNVSVFHEVDGMPIRMKIGDVSVVPVSGFKTLGEVAMLNGAVVVSTKEGMLRVEGNGQVVDVAKGKTVTVMPRTNAPQGGGAAPAAGGAAARVSATTALEIGDLAGSALGAVLGGVAVSRAGTASTNAAAAESAAAAANSTAASAVSAASAAASAAAVAVSQATAAAIGAGCALNLAVNPTGKGASPYTPPSGVSCSNSATW